MRHSVKVLLTICFYVNLSFAANKEEKIMSQQELDNAKREVVYREISAKLDQLWRASNYYRAEPPIYYDMPAKVSLWRDRVYGDPALDVHRGKNLLEHIQERNKKYECLTRLWQAHGNKQEEKEE